MSTGTHRIFVYGSLKRGYGLHDMAVERGATFECEAKLDDHTIVARKTRNQIDGIGFLVPMPGKHTEGDVLNVPEKAMAWLDRVECMYTRTPVILADRSSAEAYISQMTVEQHEKYGEKDIGAVWKMKVMLDQNARWKKQEARDQAAYDKARAKGTG